MIRDISKRKKLGEKIYEIQKMDSIGNLAGGIAHDFNNILAGLLGYASLLKTKYEGKGQDVEVFSEMIELMEKGKELTKKLLTIGRKEKHFVESIDMNKEIKTVYKILKRTLSSKIELKLDLDNSIKTIDGDRIQISQMIMNLCINARDAIVGCNKEKGFIKISTN